MVAGSPHPEVKLIHVCVGNWAGFTNNYVDDRGLPGDGRSSWEFLLRCPNANEVTKPKRRLPLSGVAIEGESAHTGLGKKAPLEKPQGM